MNYINSKEIKLGSRAASREWVVLKALNRHESLSRQEIIFTIDYQQSTLDDLIHMELIESDETWEQDAAKTEMPRRLITYKLTEKGVAYMRNFHHAKENSENQRQEIH